MSKFYNNVKSRLNKKGIKGFTKADYLLAAEHLEISNLDNVTTEQIIAGVNYLMSKQSSELVSIEKIDASVSTLQTEDTVTEPLDESSVNSLPTSDYSMDRMQAMPMAVNYALPEINQNGQSLAVTNADKQALVSTQSIALGFELSEQECLVVADSVDDVFSDYASFLTSVTTAIRGYVDHRFDEVESALDTNAHAVRSHIADRATRLNQKVENFSTNVKADIGGIRQNIKSSKANILSRFALPSKAG
jgi:hypothetical protein